MLLSYFSIIHTYRQAWDWDFHYNGCNFDKILMKSRPACFRSSFRAITSMYWRFPNSNAHGDNHREITNGVHWRDLFDSWPSISVLGLSAESWWIPLAKRGFDFKIVSKNWNKVVAHSHLQQICPLEVGLGVGSLAGNADSLRSVESERKRKQERVQVWRN